MDHSRNLPLLRGIVKQREESIVSTLKLNGTSSMIPCGRIRFAMSSGRPICAPAALPASQMPFKIKRAYEKPARGDGRRVLVDRLWPRGVARAEARIDQWCKEIAPSTALRKWFAHDPARWSEFKRRYSAELATMDEPLAELRELADGRTVTLVYGARDTENNQAVALKEYLERTA